MKRGLIITALLLTGTLSANAMADDSVAGALIGGGAGALIGHAVGGRNGAVVGGVIGAAAGVAATSNQRYYHGGYYDDGPAPVAYAPAPVYAEPAPVYVAPAPVYAAPAPVVVYRPAPVVVYRPAPVVYRPYYQGGYVQANYYVRDGGRWDRGEHRGWDRDDRRWDRGDRGNWGHDEHRGWGWGHDHDRY